MDASDTDEYLSFTSLAARSLVHVCDTSIEIYDLGPKEIVCPVVCLPPCTCDAKIFYKLQLHLCRKGYRIISINYPRAYSTEEFCKMFNALLDELQLPTVHLFGASLGGFLAQKFCEFTAKEKPRVKSLILCNSFVDNAVFGSQISSRFMWAMPAFALRMLIEFPATQADEDESVKSAMEMAKTQLNSMTQEQLASRLTMNGLPDQVSVGELQELDLTIIEVGDLDASYKTHYESINRAYPNAKVAHLDTGGHFPFLSRQEEFAAYLQMHYESYLGSEFSPVLVDEEDQK